MHCLESTSMLCTTLARVVDFTAMVVAQQDDQARMLLDTNQAQCYACIMCASLTLMLRISNAGMSLWFMVQISVADQVRILYIFCCSQPMPGRLNVSKTCEPCMCIL